MDSPVVQISDGKLKGKEWEIANGEQVLAFLGIPYGKAPVGDLRFKAPLPAEPWDGVRDAIEDGSPCYGLELMSKSTAGSEDCLFLNVFTKSVDKNKLRPVMVFIHGGGFYCGSNSSKLCNPDYLLTEDVILVAMNYRLGILGFLSLEDTSLEIPGNAGLKDQKLALEWVQKNIEQFGGDPDNVTLFGVSAGSASVHYHILSPASKGLFHKAILQSGSVHNPWPYGPSKLLEILKASGVQREDEASALEYIESLPVQELYELQTAYMKSVRATLRTFGPVVEKPNPTAFIAEEPVDIIASGNYNKVPIIIGYCDKEGLLFENNKIRTMMIGPDNAEPTIEQDVSIYLGLDQESEFFKELMKRFDEFYIQSEMEDGKTMLISDLLFTAGIIKSAKLHAATSSTPVFLYRFTFSSRMNMYAVLLEGEVPAATHGDDMGYIFNAQFVPTEKKFMLEKGSPEEAVANKMVKMWTNFAKRSNPTTPDSELGITWEHLKSNSFPFLDIGSSLVLHEDPEGERMPIWDEIEELYKIYGVRISG